MWFLARPSLNKLISLLTSYVYFCCEVEAKSPCFVTVSQSQYGYKAFMSVYVLQALPPGNPTTIAIFNARWGSDCRKGIFQGRYAGPMKWKEVKVNFRRTSTTPTFIFVMLSNKTISQVIWKTVSSSCS